MQKRKCKTQVQGMDHKTDGQNMVRETEVKAAALCTLALLAGLCCALLLGCSTSAKVEGGAEIIELKPLKMQELTYPIHDYSKIC